MNELQKNAKMVAHLLKASLEEFNLYIALDAETKEFLFFDRDDFHNNKGQVARVHMEKINVRNK